MPRGEGRRTSQSPRPFSPEPTTRLQARLSLTWLALRDRTQGCQELRAHSQRERKVEKYQQGLGRGPSYRRAEKRHCQGSG